MYLLYASLERICHLLIYGGNRWDRFVSSATSTTGTLTDMMTDLIMANNNNCTHIRITLCPLDLWTDRSDGTAGQMDGEA